MADIDRLGGTPDSSVALVARLSGIRTDVSVKRSVAVATAANITLLGLQTIDDVLLTEGDRVLVAAQTAGAENGVYAASSGSWSRVLDFNGSYDVAKGTMIFVTGGTVVGDRLYYITNADPITIGTTVLTFNYILSTTSVTVADIIAAITEAEILSKLTALNTLAKISATALGTTFIQLADAATGRSALGLGAAALLPDSTDADLTVTPTGPLRRSIAAIMFGAVVNLDPDYTDSKTTWAAGETFTHGLGAVPRKIEMWFECTSAVSGFAVGDWIQLQSSWSYDSNDIGSTYYGYSLSANSTSIYTRSYSGFRTFSPTGSLVTLTGTNFTLHVRAWR
jgi:hypothetical protein